MQSLLHSCNPERLTFRGSAQLPHAPHEYPVQVDCLCNMDPGHCHLDEAALAQSLGVVHVKCTQKYEGGDHAGHDHGETDTGGRRLKQDDHEVHWQCGMSYKHHLMS